jgi:hypothetical protein
LQVFTEKHTIIGESETPSMKKPKPKIELPRITPEQFAATRERRMKEKALKREAYYAAKQRRG